ncbi:MAG: 23S rRNA (uracil(1939)-C(5))-methyltransferase RlmD [Parachlamydiaceae bacterium]|nr:23S rRNA (uracil(1939)-C(5))-methyltransferase RlmD [Parachlamydiaceae bacterium]
MNKPQLNEIFTLTIHAIGSSGEGVGRLDGYTVFVDGALPGECVSVRLIEAHKNYGRGELISIIEPSPDRVEAPCHLFGVCGGCQIMHLSYEKQLKIKQQRVMDALQRIGKITDIEVPPCLPSPSPLGYRNKIQLPVKNNVEGLAFGLFARGSHQLVEVESCHIHCEMGDKVYREVSTLIKKAGILAYNPETGSGELRHLLIKSAIYTQQALVVLVTANGNSEKLIPLAKQIMEHSPQVKGVVQAVNKQKGNRILGESFKVLSGTGHIHEALGDLLFKVSPASFFQVNPEQALLLYAKALEFADLEGTETLLDAYCGVGTLSLFFAKHVKRVFGVECVPEAIEDAKENAALNKIGNVSFVCANAEAYISSLAAIDVAILNPPRKGCDLILLKELKRLRPKTIVYISCDPSTLARDLSHLRDFGYRIEAIQPFDMFPQTAHVECVVKLNFGSN